MPSKNRNSQYSGALEKSTHKDTIKLGLFKLKLVDMGQNSPDREHRSY